MTQNTTSAKSALNERALIDTLSQLREKAKGDYKPLIANLPKMLWSLFTDKKLMELVTPSMLKNAFLSVNKEEGLFLYNIARSSNAKTIVEFGSSFGISTLYLAAAAKDNGGKLITTEIVVEKCRGAEENLRLAKLNTVATVLEGDALITLKNFEGTVDLLFLDGWKNLYNDVLTLLLPNLKPGSIVIADNITLADAKEYMKRIKSENSGFITAVLDKKTAFSVYMSPLIARECDQLET